MSLKRKNALAFKALLLDGLPNNVPAVAAVTAQILTGYENQTITLAKQRVVINSESGPTVSAKSRNVRLRTVIIVETSADLQAADAITPEVSHAALVKQVHQILEDSPTTLAARLNGKGGSADIGDYACFGIVPAGELDLPPEAERRVLRDAWSYTATVAECIAT